MIEDIENEWFGGLSLYREAWNPREVERAFDVATKIRGLTWVLGEEIDLATFPPLPGLGRRGGYQAFLRVYWFGTRMASFARASGARDLTQAMIEGDEDAGAEASAVHILRHHKTRTDLEVAPEVQVGGRPRVPDFRIRDRRGLWVWTEVTRLHGSNVSARVHGLLTGIVRGVMGVARPFILEIILNREPSDDEVTAIHEAATGVLDRPDTDQVAVGDVASILVKSGDVRVVSPTPLYDDRPRMAISSAVVGPGQPNRQVQIRVPFADLRAEDILRYEARQLPENECGFVMVDVTAEPTAFHSWSKRIPERFTPTQHTRVAAVLLFSHATTVAQGGLIWMTSVKLIPNPHAAVPLPAWITDLVASLRERTRQITGIQ